MRITVNGFGPRQTAAIFDMVQVYAGIALGKHMTNIKSIEIKATGKIPDWKFGFARLWSIDRKKITISLPQNKINTIGDFLWHITHELWHARQLIDQRLICSANYGSHTFWWDGVIWNQYKFQNGQATKTYRNGRLTQDKRLPWEEEAMNFSIRVCGFK